MGIQSVMRRDLSFSFRVPRGILIVALWGAAAVAAAVYAWALIPWGPWAFTDSVAYVDVARNLYHGVGLYAHTTRGALEFLTHYPPGYPVLLSLGMEVLHGDWLAAATWLNVISLGLLLAVAGSWTYEATRMWGAGLLIMVVLAGFWPLTRAYLGLMSETPFMALEMVSGYLLWRYVTTGSRNRLWWAALVAGLAVLIRYGGLAAALAFGLAPLLFSQTMPRHKRWGEAVGAALLVVLPFVLWSAYVAWRGDTPPRTFSQPEVWREQALYFVNHTASALVESFWPRIKTLPPAAVGGVWAALMAAWLGGFWRWRQRRWTWSDGEALALVAWLLTWVWVPALGAMRLLVVPPPAIIVRMYTPALALGLVAGLGFLWAEVQARWPRWVGWVSLGSFALALGLIAFYIKGPHVTSRMLIAQMHRYGIGYTAKQWHGIAQEGALHVVSEFPTRQPLFSNEWEAVLLWTGRPARVVNLYAWLDASAQGRLSSLPTFAEWRSQHGALVLLWPNEPVSPKAVEAVLAAAHTLPCYRDERGWIDFPLPPLPQACPGP